MTLQSSGSMSFTQIATELGTSLPLTIPSAATRTLSGVASGPIDIPGDFYGKSAGGGASVTFEGSATGTTTVSGVPIGTAHADRRVIISISFAGTGPGGPTAQNVTIGGVAAVVHAAEGNQNSGTSATVGTAIASAIVPTGTTATVTFGASSGTVAGSKVGAWRVVGSPNSTPSSFAQDAANSGNKPASGTLNVPSGGFIIFAATLSTGTEDIVMSPATTEAFNSGGHAAIWQSGLSADASFGISTTWVAGDHGMSMAAVAWDM